VNCVLTSVIIGDPSNERVGVSRVVCEPSYVPVENLVFGRLDFKAIMSGSVAAGDYSNDKEVSDADMANRLTKYMAETLSTKRDKSGKPLTSKPMILNRTTYLPAHL
jgi:hypothetical protein